MIQAIFKEMTIKGVRNLFLSVLFFVLYALCGTAIMVVTLYLLDKVMISKNNINFIPYWYILSGLLIGKTIFNSLADMSKHYAGFDLVQQLRKKIILKLKQFSLGFYTNECLGEISTIIHKDVDNMEMVVGHLWTRMIADFVIALFFLIALFSVDYKMGLIMISVLPFGLWILYAGIHKSLKIEKRTQDNLANMVSLFVEYIKGIPTLKIFGVKNLFKDNLEESTEGFGNNSKIASRLTAEYMGKYMFFLELAFALTATLGAYLLFKGNLSLFVYLIFVVMAKEFYKPFTNMETHYINYIKVKDSYARINRLIKEPMITPPQAPQTTTKFNISFENINFYYEDNGFQMKNLSFTVLENTVTALVGSSGSGKTTITNLLLRFWEPQSGVIKIGNTNIQNMDYDYLLQHISIVMQNVLLFSDTIYNNIKIGNKNATKEQIEVAAKRAMIHDFITKLPNGYQTEIGENGSGLSGGQKQRISIARAFLKNAPILILDEITSNVDPINEWKIQKAVSELVKDRTVLVIAHHLNTIQNVDQIIVLENGVLKEKGTHVDLLSKSNAYANLFA